MAVLNTTHVAGIHKQQGMGLWPFGGSQQKAEPKGEEEAAKCGLNLQSAAKLETVLCSIMLTKPLTLLGRREAPQAVKSAQQAVDSAPQPSAKADGDEPADVKRSSEAAIDLPLPAVFEFGGCEVCH